jgi:hypothetical protein
LSPNKFPDILPDIIIEIAIMNTSQQRAIEDYRKRLKERGLVRLEIQVLEPDAPLIRQITKVLRGDPLHAAKIRTQLHQIVGTEQKHGLKVLLASAPLEGIDLSRSQDRGRDVDL